jgi:hypothetical protein
MAVPVARDVISRMMTYVLAPVRWPALAGLCLWPLLVGAIDSSADFEVRILAVHNRERSTLGIGALRWSDRLAGEADLWARHLARTGRLVHSQSDPGDPDPEGENLWMGTAGYYSVEQGALYWARERRDYRPGIFPDNSRSRNLENVGHYTQMMWRSTGSMGCAMARNRHDQFLVCRYLEGGNIIGERPF